MYKKVSPLPEELNLVLNFQNKEVKITFNEPSIYDIFKVERLLNNKKYLEIIDLLNIPIDQKVFLSNPAWILKWIFKLLNKHKDDEINKIEDKKENTNFFLFSIFDKLWEKYSKDPVELMKIYTPSQISKVAEGIDFNKNILDKKEYKNDKYIDPDFIEKQKKDHEEIMKRVYEAKEKLGYS